MYTRAKAFTIVELIVIIIVIGILATVGTVAFTTVQKQSRDSKREASIATITEALERYFQENGEYPTCEALQVDISATLPWLDKATVIAPGASSDTTSSIVCSDAAANDKDAYVYTGTCSTNAACESYTLKYKEESSSSMRQLASRQQADEVDDTPTPPTITNLYRNPSFEVNDDGTWMPSGSQRARTTSRKYNGSYSIEVTMPGDKTTSQAGVLLLQTNSSLVYLQPNTTYTISAYVYVPSATRNVALSVQGTGRASRIQNGSQRATQKDQWVRINETFSTKETGQIILYILNDQTTQSSETKFWVDAIMLTEGADLNPYADGSSPGWSWAATPGASQSQGPRL